LDYELLVAVLSAAGAVISAYVSLRLARKREREDCDRRVEEVKEAMREGMEMGR
jgi:hypothetical protein